MKNLQEQVAYLHDVALNKEKIHERLHEQYKHIFATYEQRKKDTLDLQCKISILGMCRIMVNQTMPLSGNEKSVNRGYANLMCNFKLGMNFQSKS